MTSYWLTNKSSATATVWSAAVSWISQERRNRIPAWRAGPVAQEWLQGNQTPKKLVQKVFTGRLFLNWPNPRWEQKIKWKNRNWWRRLMGPGVRPQPWPTAYGGVWWVWGFAHSPDVCDSRKSGEFWECFFNHHVPKRYGYPQLWTVSLTYPVLQSVQRRAQTVQAVESTRRRRYLSRGRAPTADLCQHNSIRSRVR